MHSFDEMRAAWPWEEIPGCPGRLRLRVPMPDTSPVQLAGDGAVAVRMTSAGCKDPIELVSLAGGGGLLCYHRADGTYVHTLNTAAGLARKLTQLQLAVPPVASSHPDEEPMTHPARAGVLLYAKHLDNLARFYRELLQLRILASAPDHVIAANDDIELVVHAIPPPIAADIAIATPPAPREEQAIKPFFTVANLADARLLTQRLGGLVLGPTWNGPGFQAQSVCDPEGNIVQLREVAP